ncbi:hypothetical protein [Sphingomonas profundi]|uniref:hypothetical protein n=1 Tax=Alterirhizorhabdus profundi TaxID=2681549 RepID=UPI0012E94191|nr:hypothetical protein [Sphingomonas profundi]
MTGRLVLRVRAGDRSGIVARTASPITAHGGDIRAAEVDGGANTGGFGASHGIAADELAVIGGEIAASVPGKTAAA